eukprot:2466967-Ditylum_brightwellii.AAC.1
MKKPCTVLVRAKLKIPNGSGAAEGDSDKTLVCEVDPQDADGKTNMLAKLNMDSIQQQQLMELIQIGKVESGQLTYFDPDAIVTEEGIFLPPGKAVVMHMKQKKGNGNMKKPCTVLVRAELKIPNGNGAVEGDTDETLVCEVDPQDADGKTN